MRVLFLLPAILLLAAGCELAKLGDPVIVSDVEKEFLIAPWEKLEPGRRSFQLLVSSIREQPCLNARVDYTVNRVNNSIDISLKNIIPAADCNPGTAPARATIDLGPLSTGFYECSINLKADVFNRGQLTVYPDRYVINLRSRNGFNLSQTELRRVPDQMVWGYVTYQEQADAGLAEQFVRDLGAISQPLALPLGYYGYFRIADDGRTIAVTDHPVTSRIRQFFFRHTGTGDALPGLLAHYRAAYPDKLTIHLLDAEGKEW